MVNPVHLGIIFLANLEPVFVLVPFQPASYDCLSLDRSLLADSDGGSSADYLLSTNDFDPG